ncbi:hypothetical protein Rumeso_04389 [Rubellimicrobium mesophilum DSM 19309]|uniref:Uncharacterized protein n=2 Tax=Rubellimicrobium TaxID=295418 RepID=A0A017HIQ6_9RHOB|nr:hypothetical protein Rumeso_04389 [Rubellimicrobium mesophilum DSM 19309]
MLQIRIISDDAYESYEGKGERDARGFADAAGSRSSLALLGWKCTGQYDGPWIDGLWNHAEYPDGDGKASVQSDPPVSVVRKTFDIADLGTREEVERAVEAFKGVLRRELGLIVP